MVSLDLSRGSLLQPFGPFSPRNGKSTGALLVIGAQ